LLGGGSTWTRTYGYDAPGGFLFLIMTMFHINHCICKGVCLQGLEVGKMFWLEWKGAGWHGAEQRRMGAAVVVTVTVTRLVVLYLVGTGRTHLTLVIRTTKRRFGGFYFSFWYLFAL